MESLVEAVASADNVWAVVAIFLLGIYVLAWKYGGELLKLARENNRVAKAAAETAQDVKSEAQEISKNIITNHGSKNIGDAIDRLTEWMLTHMAETRENDERMMELRQEFALHLASSETDRKKMQNMFAELDDRITAVEPKDDR